MKTIYKQGQFQNGDFAQILIGVYTYLEQYRQRSKSESGFAADKKMLGWNIAQRRGDMIDNALFCTGTWHNLFNMGRS